MVQCRFWAGTRERCLQTYPSLARWLREDAGSIGQPAPPLRFRAMSERPFKVLGLQQIAIGGLDLGALANLWIDTLGVPKVGEFTSERENVREDILRLGDGAHAVEIDLMQPLDPESKPKVHEPTLNHIGLWVDDLASAVDWLSEQGATSVGLLRQDNDLGAAFKAGLEEQAPKYDMEIVAEEVVEPQSTDVSAQVLNIRNAEPDAVISGADNTQTALLLDQAFDLGWEPIIIGNSSTAGPGAMGTVGAAAPEAAEGFYGSAILAFTTSDAAEVEAYRAAMDAAGHADVADNAFGLQAYAHSIVFYSVLESMGDDLCWDALHASLESLAGFETGLVAPVTFGPVPGGHSGTTGARIAQYNGGEWEFLTEFIQPQD